MEFLGNLGEVVENCFQHLVALTISEMSNYVFRFFLKVLFTHVLVCTWKKLNVEVFLYTNFLI